MKRNAALFLLTALLMAIAFLPCLAETRKEAIRRLPRLHDTARSRSIGPYRNHDVRIAGYHVERNSTRRRDREEFVFSIDTK